MNSFIISVYQSYFTKLFFQLFPIENLLDSLSVIFHKVILSVISNWKSFGQFFDTTYWPSQMVMTSIWICKRLDSIQYLLYHHQCLLILFYKIILSVISNWKPMGLLLMQLTVHLNCRNIVLRTIIFIKRLW